VTPIDLTTVGPGGLDIGALAAGKAYALWALSGVSGTTVVASLSFTAAGVAPVGGGGYAVQARRVGSFMTDPTVARVNPFAQEGLAGTRGYRFLDFPNFDNYVVFASAPTGVYTQSVATLLPPSANAVQVYFYQNGGATHGGSLGVAEVGYSGAACAYVTSSIPQSVANAFFALWGWVALPAQTIEYHVTNTDDTDPCTNGIAVFGYAESL